MSVIGKLITRHIRLPLRFSLVPNKQRAYSILGQKRFTDKFQLNNQNFYNYWVLKKSLCLVKRFVYQEVLWTIMITERRADITYTQKHDN